MCFLDLTGYTRLTEERGDDAAADLAARIAEYARPGEVLVSQEVVDAADGGPVTFTEIGPVELKGVSGPLHPGGLAFRCSPLVTAIVPWFMPQICPKPHRLVLVLAPRLASWAARSCCDLVV
jgi:hypothetical protein